MMTAGLKYLSRFPVPIQAFILKAASAFSSIRLLLASGLSLSFFRCHSALSTSTIKAFCLVYLQVSALRLEPVFDELLGVVAEAQHEVSLCLQLVNVLNRFMNLSNQKSRF